MIIELVVLAVLAGVFYAVSSPHAIQLRAMLFILLGFLLVLAGCYRESILVVVCGEFVMLAAMVADFYISVICRKK